MLTSMNLAGSLRLFTSASLIVHPQFESENLRKRVQLGYELYHCGSEASFAQTMRKLKAEIVIFEYFRCFLTPYILDDRRKNCDSKKHKPEDQLCVKLHTSQHLFKLIFANGGFAVFRLNALSQLVKGCLQNIQLLELLVYWQPLRLGRTISNFARSSKVLLVGLV